MSYRYASQTIRLYRGDAAQPISLVQVFNESSGDPYDLTDWSTGTEYPVLSLYSLSDTATIVHTLQLSVVDAATGWVSIEWDTDLSEHESGHYGAQIQLTSSSGTVVDHTIDRHIKFILLDPVGP